MKSHNRLQKRIHVEINGDSFPHILVEDQGQMIYLWDNGFFGTGQLSRSEPTWRSRTSIRLGINDDTLQNEQSAKSQVALEKLTERRRQQRLEFKRERDKSEKQLLELRRKGGSIEEEEALLEKEREALREYKANQLLKSVDEEEPNELRMEDENLIDENGRIIKLESLQLMPVEAIFLSYALPVIDIPIPELMERLCGGTVEYETIHKLITRYVAYHHYRSHGWCVRSGIKFGCDYILYKRGPPFQHAEFCIMVMDAEVPRDYTWYSTVARVTGGARKTFVLCYVQRLVSQDKILEAWDRKDFTTIFSSYKVAEVIYKRWVPGKNRD